MIVLCALRTAILHLQHVLLKDEVLPPILCDVLLDRTAWRAVVIEPCHTAIDFEGWHVK